MDYHFSRFCFTFDGITSNVRCTNRSEFQNFGINVRFSFPDIKISMGNFTLFFSIFQCFGIQLPDRGKY